MPRQSKQHLESHYLSKVANSVGRGSVISHGFTPDGDEHIFLDGKVRRSFEDAVDAVGLEETWDFLTKDCMVAHTAKGDQTVRER